MRAKPSWAAIDRRRFLKHVWHGVGAGIGLALLPGERARAAPRLSRNPFTLGVASGDPTASGIVLWTRLAPEPADPERLGRNGIAVGWRVASDARLRNVVSSGSALAPAELAHSVHVEVNGLKPGREYFYQFNLRNEESPIGRFRTAPAADVMLARARLAFATCQDWPSGHYTAYRDMLQHDLDLVVHLGDYTYEYAIGDSKRADPLPSGFEAETVDLRTYRLRHALHKLDPDLQAAHARFPFAVVWDDHEVQNDYSGLAPEGGSPSPEFAARRAAAYQAFYEHLPLRSPVTKLPVELPIYRGLNYGRLFQLDMLDDRQYRSDNPCGDGEQLRCPAALSGEYTMLGTAQERWLTDRFQHSRARWNLIGQQLLLAELEHLPNQQNLYWQDAWDGYPLARQRMFEALQKTKLKNPVFFTGDWHSTFVNDLLLDFKDRRAAPVATEFVTPAITTGGDGTPYGPYYGPMIPHNPHIKYFEGDKRGYFMATLEPRRMQLDLRFVKSVEDPDATGYHERSWVVEDGRPGAVPA
jgi:alkaline phosphatase D